MPVREFLRVPSRTTLRQIGWSGGMLAPLLVTILCWGGSLALPAPLNRATYLTLIAVIVCCAITDFRSHRIPNWATYPGLFWALALNLTGSLLATDASGRSGVRSIVDPTLIGPTALGAIGIGPSLAGAIACFLLMAFCTRGLKGAGGDVKLATVIGAFLGLRLGLFALCTGYILAAAIASIGFLWRIGAVAVVRDAIRWAGHLLFPVSVARPVRMDRDELETTIPLGSYFAAGVVFALLLIQGPS